MPSTFLRNLITISERGKRQKRLMSREKHQDTTAQASHARKYCSDLNKRLQKQKPSKYLWSEPGLGSVFSNMDPITLLPPTTERNESMTLFSAVFGFHRPTTLHNLTTVSKLPQLILILCTFQMDNYQLFNQRVGKVRSEISINRNLLIERMILN